MAQGKKFGCGIHGLVKKGDQYLVIRRSLHDHEDPGAWDLPGGGLEIGEQPFDGVLRETAEEAGISIRVLHPLTVWAFHTHGRWSVELEVFCEYVSGDIRLSTEHTEYKWVTKEELKALQPTSMHVQAIINTL
ncbi:MAG: NUDIX domain-containing protein [Candidatus Kerfeldbacteria bacterium]|nr:NUDIX domain-containing protein [Candidatus Kerfeldbacteria bacterium]